MDDHNEQGRFTKGNRYRATPGNTLQSRKPQSVDVEAFARSLPTHSKPLLVGRKLSAQKVVNRIALHIAKCDAVRTPSLYLKLERRLANASDRLVVIEEAIRNFDAKPVSMAPEDCLLAAVERAERLDAQSQPTEYLDAVAGIVAALGVADERYALHALSGAGLPFDLRQRATSALYSANAARFHLRNGSPSN